jgi:hypothetical protein
MALSYDESAQLMNDQTFRGRVKTACLKFANSVLVEESSVPAHNSRYRWAVQCEQIPDQTAAQVTPPTVLDPAVQSAGSAIDDATLQAAVEGTINKLL